MSRHEGVSCDSCLKGSFRGKRYKCLICYDYDLCATCFEAGATTTRHTSDHPMQCIITRADFDLYYGGENMNPEQPQAFTCPFCAKMGYTEATLLEHVTADHAGSSTEVVCPICASLAGGDPNHVTDDFSAHLALEHRTPREFEEPVGSGIRHVRRIPHPGRGVGGARTRRSNMHFPSAGSALSGLSPSGRETMDPIAELLSQLSSVRSRAAAAQNVSTQLQQLEMQLQSTSNPYSRQQLERLPRQAAEAATKAQQAATAPTPVPGTTLEFPSPRSANSQFLLSRISEPDPTESERQTQEVERADRSLFVQELFLSTLSQGLRLDESDSDETDSDSDPESLGAFGSNPRRRKGNSSGTQQLGKAPANNRKKARHLEGSGSSNQGSSAKKEPPPSQAH